MRKKQERKFATETELCQEFIQWAADQGWTAYPETRGYDIVLVKDGIQIGIQAKLKFNATLLRQILPTAGDDNQMPDHLAVLLPRLDREENAVCDAVGVGYFYYKADAYMDRWRFMPAVEGVCRFDCCDGLKLTLPEYVPEVAAGASSPVVLTDWKIRALKLCAIMEIRGYLTAQDFKDYAIDKRRWFPMGWAVLKDGKYVAGPNLRFPTQHPQTFQKIVAEFRTEPSPYINTPSKG